MASGCAKQKVTLGHNFFSLLNLLFHKEMEEIRCLIYLPPYGLGPLGIQSHLRLALMRSEAIWRLGEEVIWRLGAHMLPTQSHLLLRIRHLTPGVCNPLPLTNHTSTLLAAICIDFKPVLFNSFFMLSRSSDFRLESFNAFTKLKDAQSENKNKLYQKAPPD